MTDSTRTSAIAGAEAAAPSAAAAFEFLRSWLRLIEAEWALASRSLYWLLVAAVAVPIVALGAWLALGVALLAALRAATGGWLTASLLAAAMQLLLLRFVLARSRCCARELTLPESRAAWTRVTGGSP